VGRISPAFGSETGCILSFQPNQVAQMQLKTAKPPKHLGKSGAKLWEELTTEYGIADAAGLTLVATACECLDRMRAAQAAIAKHGEVIDDRYGAPKLNPACSLEKDARNGLLAALKALNLDLEPLKDSPGRPPSQFAGTTLHAD
jgi:P27 family predicted phage terminase small subunit